MEWIEESAEHRWDVPVRRATGEPGRALVVALHGMGENERTMTRRLESLAPRGFPLLVPRAPHPLEIRRGERIRIGHAWYHYDGDETRFVSSMEHAASFLFPLIDRAAGESAASGVVLLGFSQGAYLAYYLALRHASRFAGVCGIAGRAKAETVRPHLASARSVRVLHLHGKDDRDVSADACRESIEELRAAGLDASFRLLSGGHDVTPEMVQVFGDFAEGRTA